MSLLPAPWPGLARCAPHVDLWPLLAALGGPAAAVAAPSAAWAAVGAPPGLLMALGDAPWPSSGVHAASPQWPAQLVGLPRGPVALAAEGELSLLGLPCVAIVGSRSATSYGREWAARLASAVVDAGAVVVSGLARGIDAAAHEAARGRTVAVLGQGLEAPMPEWQERLRRSIVAAGGLVLSELPPAMRADRGTFPVRNRIVAGLSRAVVVVEAGHRSGARNTVRHALHYGREVWAVPGPLGAPVSEGCLDLLEEGASMVRSPEALVVQLGLQPASHAAEEGGDHTRLLAALSQVAELEALQAATGLPLEELLAALGALELAGRVARLPGQRYVLRAHASPLSGPAPRVRAPRGGLPGALA